jgi:hypothetical protein
VFKSFFSVHDEPLYSSVNALFLPEAGGLVSPPKPKAAVCNPAPPNCPLAVFKLPPVAHVAPGKSVIVSLKVFVVELKYNCPSDLF